MADPMLALTDHVKAGDDLMMRLKSARARKDIAEHVCALRRWHRDLRPLVQAYSAPLAESLRMLNPRRKEYERVAGTYTSLAQIRLLMTTATALYRLSPHLANAAPVKRKNKGGRPKHQYPELVEAARKELLAQVARGDKLVKAKAFEAALKPLGLDGDKYERLVRWLYDQEWDLAALGKPVSRIK